MEVNFDPTVHCQYCSDLISCDGEAEKPMVKLDDCNSQIIPFFKFIRKTYLDELPQLINVLRGEMSLVGPRPPIPYEVAEYSRWHNNRFDIVPGMTGLWQISGKNRLTFKEMVRLDISYCRKLSFIMDLKILFNTPLAIVSELFSPDKQMFTKRG
jgi:lipopolysaccharide/colanic/teichoic acid biosynthesis glycosyltransferase